MDMPIFTVFSDADSPGWADGFADVLHEGAPTEVGIAEDLDTALGDDVADVLVLNLRRRTEEKLSPRQVAALKKRRIIAMAPGSEWLYRQLDELEIHFGNVTGDFSTVAVDSDLLGKRVPKEPIRPFRNARNTPVAEWTSRTPKVHFGAGDIAVYRPRVDYILAAEDDERYAVVMRQASIVLAGVQAHPDEWSAEYRTLIRRVAFALADRPVEALAPIVIDRPIAAPGSTRFELPPISSGESATRALFFRFESPTAFTATLEHSGSQAMMLLFSGGKNRLHWTRKDTESGQPLTIAVNIGAAAIQAVGHRHWHLLVDNFDGDNAAVAKLTIRYDTESAQTRILPLPGNAGLEHVNRHAKRLLDASAGDVSAARDDIAAPTTWEQARAATADAYGFASWDLLCAHVAWELPAPPPSAMAFGANDFYERGVARHRDSFSIDQLTAFTGDFSDDVVDALKAAFAQAKTRGHRSFTGEHLLSALLGHAVAVHALRSCGCDVESLTREVDALLAALPATTFDGDVQASKALCEAVYRADAIPVLGGEGTNAGNLLAGLVDAAGEAAKLIAAQGVTLGGVVNYVSHGIAATPVQNPGPGAPVLASDLATSAHDAYRLARRQQAYLTVEHLLLALLDAPRVADALRSMDKDIRALQGELATFVETATPAGAGEPTRAFNRVMQMAVAKARSSKRRQANAVDALWALAGEVDVPVADFLARYGIARTDVAGRMDR